LLQINGDVIVLASNEENQRRVAREETVRMDESIKLVEVLRNGKTESV